MATGKRAEENKVIQTEEVIDCFTQEDLSLAKQLSFKNMEKDDTNIGFEFHGLWITNPFVEETGRFEFKNPEDMCNYYGTEKIHHFIAKILCFK